MEKRFYRCLSIKEYIYNDIGFHQNAPKDWIVATSPKGWTSNSLGLWWLKEHFEPAIQPLDNSYRFLILDGHGSHCTSEFQNFCNRQKIILFCLPPHTSYMLQPLDVVVSSSMKHYFRHAVENVETCVLKDFLFLPWHDYAVLNRGHTNCATPIRLAINTSGTSHVRNMNNVGVPLAHTRINYITLNSLSNNLARYIGNMNERFQAVVDAKGGHTKWWICKSDLKAILIIFSRKGILSYAIRPRPPPEVPHGWPVTFLLLI